MNIYVAHSTGFDYMGRLYQPIRDKLVNHDTTFTLPHELSDDANNSKAIIKNSDIVIAEVSYPSTGLGIELGWADELNTPVYCIHEAGKAISTSIKMVSNQCVAYEGIEDMISCIQNILRASVQ